MGLPYIVFESASGRAKCRICEEPILKDEPSVKSLIGSGFYPHTYHENCFLSCPNLHLKELAFAYLRMMKNSEEVINSVC